MTLMLASVVDAAEAKLAFDGGADVIDFCDLGGGPLGPIDAAMIASALAAIDKPAMVSAALGAPPYDAETISARAQALVAAGVGTLRLAPDALGQLEGALFRLARKARLVGALFADRNPDFGALERLSTLGFHGALIDVAEKGGGRLFDHLPPARIEAFCRRCHELNLAAWVAGSLQTPDIPRLMIVEPDVLGFRSALCRRGRREGPLEPRRIRLVRDLIPPERRRTGAPPPAGAGRLAPAAEAGDGAFDVIFVRDFLANAEIGAYAHERGVQQRLRFNIEASVARAAAPADDLRAIVSYDVILDAVRIVVGRGHVDFIETVAEEVAAIVLRHPRVQSVRVRVEKLDVVAGAVGVEIVRRREV